MNTGTLPDDEHSLAKQLEAHKKFLIELGDQESKLHECLDMGGDILKKVHPDASATVKHWITILRSRWDEVSCLVL